MSSLSDLDKDIETENDVILKNERLLKETLDEVEVYTVIGIAHTDVGCHCLTLYDR